MTWRSASPPVQSRLLGEDGVATLDDTSLALEFTAGRWRFKTAVALRSYPLDAIADLVYEPPAAGRNGSISVVIQPGRDPLRDFLAARARSVRTDPDCLVVTVDQAAAAGHFVARAREAAARAAPSRAAVTTGRLPIELTGADGTAGFDGRNLVLAFGGRGAERAKKELGTRVIPVAAIRGVEVRHGESGGWIRFVPVTGPQGPRLPPGMDPDTLRLNPDSSRRHLVLAAAVTLALPRRRPALDLPPARRLTGAVPRQRPPGGDGAPAPATAVPRQRPPGGDGAPAPADAVLRQRPPGGDGAPAPADAVPRQRPLGGNGAPAPAGSGTGSGSGSGARDAVPADRLGPEAALVRAAGLVPYRLPSAGERVEVVGESHHQPALRAIAGGRAVAPSALEAAIGAIAVLVPEPGNRYDPTAVRVDLLDGRGDARTAGYLPRYLAADCHGDLAGIGPGFGYCPARIFGGGPGRSYGVHLRLSARAILPFRNPYPDGLLLHAQRRVIVAGEPADSPVLSRFAPDPRQPRVWVMAELSPATVTSGEYRGEPTIAVSLGGDRIGETTSGQARHCEGLVREIRAVGERALCEGYVQPEPDGRWRVELFLPRS